jgi:hypothetical protein
MQVIFLLSPFSPVTGATVIKTNALEAYFQHLCVIVDGRPVKNPL